MCLTEHMQARRSGLNAHPIGYRAQGPVKQNRALSARSERRETDGVAIPTGPYLTCAPKMTDLS